MTALAFGGLATPVLSSSAEAAQTIASQCSSNYQVGAKNNVACVKLIQTGLNTLKYTDNSGAKLAVDGSYGTKTKQAVIKFQKAKSLSQDGIAGPKTIAALDKALGNTPIPAPTSSKLTAVVSKAQATVDKRIPYVWAGGHTALGPTTGQKETVKEAGSQAAVNAYWTHDKSTKGLDCSGFVRYVYYQAGVTDLGGGFTSSTPASDSKHWTKVTASTAKAGDVVVYSGHIAIYDGKGKIFEEPGHTYPTKWGYSVHTRSVTSPGTPTYYHYKGI